jgi:signal transduction histidine kinase
MEGSVKKLHDLIDRLRPGSPSTEVAQSVDPAQIVREIVGEFGNDEVSVCAEISDASVRIGIAPSTLRSILTHLVRNAVEASERDSSVVIRLASQAHKTCIEVIDKGCGMRPEFIQNGLFEPLRTTKQRGHGIGAFQARELVRVAGGDLQVSSVVGRGTTMRVLLPECAGEDGDAQLVKTVAQ